MNQPDPIEVMLWHLLTTQTAVQLDQVYAWDSGRAEAACIAAGMRLVGAWWFTGPDTAHWFEETWNAIRTTTAQATAAPEEPAPEEPAAPAQPEAPRARHLRIYEPPTQRTATA